MLEEVVLGLVHADLELGSQIPGNTYHRHGIGPVRRYR